MLGICVGMQIMFEHGVEFSDASENGTTEGAGEWPGTVSKLTADVLPHMGWNTVDVDHGGSEKGSTEGSIMFRGIDTERFYFVHSYGVQDWELFTDGRTEAPKVHWAEHGQSHFVAAVENGPLWATQFHPEKSGQAGLQLLRNWISTLQ